LTAELPGNHMPRSLLMPPVVVRAAMSSARLSRLPVNGLCCAGR
jgi:hypothetical protein